MISMFLHNPANTLQEEHHMQVHELTEEERNRMCEQWLKMVGVEPWHPTREELEHEITDYLRKNQPCSLATCSADGIPRVSVVDYVNDGLVLYIFSEGGDKFKNLSQNKRVAVGIGTSARKALSCRGVNISGIADVFTEETAEFAHGVKLFSRLFNNLKEEMGKPIEFPKGLMRMIRVTPLKMTYHHNRKGIKNAHWESEGAR
jgi:nitroimidazol reductase NimA-like FMN-containing flavoprotein (pyridoxamine 5'-phosphate oxidase superfamily)